jgi:hypothetical protein
MLENCFGAIGSLPRRIVFTHIDTTTATDATVFTEEQFFL